MPKLTKRLVDVTAAGNRDRFVWDEDVRGFGLKVTPVGRKIYILQYRMGGRGVPTRRLTIGRHGQPWTVDQARTEARRLLGHVATGRDPQAEKRSDREQRSEAAKNTVGDLVTMFVERRYRANGLRTADEVERIFAWLGRCRRLAKDWETSIASAEAWITIAHIRIVTRRLARYCQSS